MSSISSYVNVPNNQNEKKNNFPNVYLNSHQASIMQNQRGYIKKRLEVNHKALNNKRKATSTPANARQKYNKQNQIPEVNKSFNNRKDDRSRNSNSVNSSKTHQLKLNEPTLNNSKKKIVMTTNPTNPNRNHTTPNTSITEKPQMQPRSFSVKNNIRKENIPEIVTSKSVKKNGLGHFSGMQSKKGLNLINMGNLSTKGSFASTSANNSFFQMKKDQIKMNGSSSAKNRNNNFRPINIFSNIKKKNNNPGIFMNNNKDISGKRSLIKNVNNNYKKMQMKGLMSNNYAYNHPENNSFISDPNRVNKANFINLKDSNVIEEMKNESTIEQNDEKPTNPNNIQNVENNPVINKVALNNKVSILNNTYNLINKENVGRIPMANNIEKVR